jgi:hypothetical protein
VVAGETVTAVPLVTAPTPLLTEPVPLLNKPVNVVEPPAVIVVAVAVKLVMVGAGTTVRAAVGDELLKLAWMFPVAVVVTVTVVTLNWAVLAPAATVTVAWGVAAALVLERVTTSPPVAAGPDKVTVPVVLVPPVTVDWAKVTMLTTGGFTVSVAVLATPYVAVIVAGVEALTAFVVTWKVPDVWPAATVAVAGTTATPLLLDNVTVAAAAAAPVSVTVPVDEIPPVTVVGFSATEASAGLIRTLRLAVAVWGVGVAESVTVTVKLNVPQAVGVPESTPLGLNVSPVGSAPEAIAQV